MGRELVKFPDETVVLPMQYAGSIGYYAVMASAGNVVVDCTMRHNKRFKSTHRMEIADTHGNLQLTVPVSISKDATHRPLAWTDIVVSPQAAWWNVHLTALESAYGRTPFFQYYIDRFAPLYTSKYEKETVRLCDLDREIDGEVCDILGITQAEWSRDCTGQSIDHNLVKDYRYRALPAIDTVEYYQVKALKQGFISNLSILDLIFNMGPEAPLILKKMIRSLKEL